MEILFYLFSNTVSLLISFVLLCMFIRAILSFLPIEEGPLTGIVALITEPVIFPVRKICEKFGLGDGLPIDIPFFITSVILMMISMFV